MKQSLKIYLAGSVPKGDRETKNFMNWRLEYADVIRKVIPNAEFIDPFERGDFDESDFMAVFGADCRHIKNCDLVVINGEDRLGVGTSQELVIAKYFKKPVITILPKDTHHRRSNLEFRGQIIEDWIHPFIFAFSDLILEKTDDLNKVDLQKIKPKDISIIDQSILKI